MRISYKKALCQKVKPGRPSTGNKPEKKELIKLYVKESKSIRETAELLGFSKDMIYRSLKEFDIKRRERLYKSELHKYSFEFLENEIKSKGYKQVATELKVEIHTLIVHFNRRKNKKSHSVA